VAKGLIALRRRDHIGHTALMDVSRLNGLPEAWHLGFILGPRINAGGRIGRADLGVRLLLEGDVSEAARIATELDRLNTERRVIEQAAEAQAEALASLGLEDKGSVIVTASEGWHPGVVGLVAARLKEKFFRPAFAIALEPGGIGTGSGRSIGGVDLGRAVRTFATEAPASAFSPWRTLPGNGQERLSPAGRWHSRSHPVRSGTYASWQLQTLGANSRR